MSKETRIEAEYSPMHCKIRLFGCVGSSSEDTVRAIEPIVTAAEPVGFSFEPFLELERKEAQYLLESLWKAGVRSPEITSTLGEINATKNHLKDMQRLVFDEKR
jgi:hypothetical protein